MNVYHLVRGGGKVFKNPKCFLLEKSCKTRIIIWHQPKQFTSIFGKIPPIYHIFALSIWSPQKKCGNPPVFSNLRNPPPKKKNTCFPLPGFSWTKFCSVPRNPGEAQAHDQGRQRYGNLVRRGFIIQPQKPIGGWTNPSEKYYSNGIISPSWGENKKYLKPPTSSKANGNVNLWEWEWMETIFCNNPIETSFFMTRPGRNHLTFWGDSKLCF